MCLESPHSATPGPKWKAVPGLSILPIVKDVGYGSYNGSGSSRRVGAHLYSHERRGWSRGITFFKNPCPRIYLSILEREEMRERESRQCETH